MSPLRTVPLFADRAYPPIKALFVTKSKICRLGWASGALAAPVPYRPVTGIAIYHVSVDRYAVMIAEHDLAGHAVPALGDRS